MSIGIHRASPSERKRGLIFYQDFSVEYFNGWDIRRDGGEPQGSSTDIWKGSSSVKRGIYFPAPGDGLIYYRGLSEIGINGELSFITEFLPTFLKNDGANHRLFNTDPVGSLTMIQKNSSDALQFDICGTNQVSVPYANWQSLWTDYTGQVLTGSFVNGGAYSVRLNGSSVATGTGSWTYSPAEKTSLGYSFSSTYHLTGIVSRVFVFNKALSDEELDRYV